MTHINRAVEERASEDDRRWFATHPARRHRWRARFPGELGADLKFTHVLVTQTFPGARQRQAARWLGRVHPADDDAQLARLGDLLAVGKPACVFDGRVTGLEDLPVNGESQ